MSELVKISKIYVSRESKAGKPFKTPLVSLYFESGGVKKKASGFVKNGSPCLKWEPGDEKEIDLEQNGEYLNFTVPDNGSQVEDEPKEDKNVRLMALETRVSALEAKLAGKGLANGEVSAERDDIPANW